MRYRFPKAIRSGIGTQFMSQDFKNLLTEITLIIVQHSPTILKETGRLKELIGCQLGSKKYIDS